MASTEKELETLMEPPLTRSPVSVASSFPASQALLSSWDWHQGRSILCLPIPGAATCPGPSADGCQGRLSGASPDTVGSPLADASPVAGALAALLAPLVIIAAVPDLQPCLPAERYAPFFRNAQYHVWTTPIICISVFL